MIKLSHTQAEALLSHMDTVKRLLSRLESLDGPTRAIRNSLIDDCEQWQRVLMEKKQGSP